MLGGEDNDEFSSDPKIQANHSKCTYQKQKPQKIKYLFLLISIRKPSFVILTLLKARN